MTEPNAMYRYFGVIGGPIGVAAVVGVLTLAVALWHERLTRRLALIATLLHAAAPAIWLTVVLPANLEIGTWSAEGVPADWEVWRNRWEAGHAVSFVLLLVGFRVLVLTVLAEQYLRGRGASERTTSP